MKQSKYYEILCRRIPHSFDPLLLLPHYSPDLTPIERVWKLTRQLCLHNVYFAKLDQLCATPEQRFDQWSAGSSARHSRRNIIAQAVLNLVSPIL